jgi:hypothetical protein
MTKQVRSDLKDVHEAEAEREREAEKKRWPVDPADRSDHVTRAIPRGDNEQRGGRERGERRGGAAVGPTRGDPRH